MVSKRASRPQQRYFRPRSAFSDQVFFKSGRNRAFSAFGSVLRGQRGGKKTHGEEENEKTGDEEERERGKTGRIRGRRIEEPNAEITNACTASSQGEKQPACATATSRTNTRAESQRKRVSRAPDPLEELGLLPLERRRSRTKPSPETASDAHCDPRHLIDASPYPRRSARKAHNPPPCGSRAPHPSPKRHRTCMLNATCAHRLLDRRWAHACYEATEGAGCRYPRSRRAFSLASVSAGMRSATVFLRATLGVSSRRASS